MTVAAPYLVAKAALNLLAFYESLNIRSELPHNLKGSQIQSYLGASLFRELDCSLKQVLPARDIHLN